MCIKKFPKISIKYSTKFYIFLMQFQIFVSIIDEVMNFLSNVFYKIQYKILHFLNVVLDFCLNY